MAGVGASDVMHESVFRKGLKLAMAEFWAIPGSLPTDDEDRLVLLSEKDFEGKIYWRHFVQHFCGELDLTSHLAQRLSVAFKVL